MQKILTKRERLILVLTILVIITGIGFNFLITPLLNRYNSQNREINLAVLKLKKYRTLISQKNSILEKYNKYSTGDGVINAGKDPIVKVLQDLEKLASEANIRIVDIRPQTATGSFNLYKEVIVEVRTEGAMDGYLRFIYDIEHSISLLRIKKFQLSAKPSTSAIEGFFSISQIAPEQISSK